MLVVDRDMLRRIGERVDLLAATPEERAELVPSGTGGFEWMIADLERFWQSHAPAPTARPERLTKAWYAKEILFYLRVLRSTLAAGHTDSPEAVILAALRLGQYSEEAKWRFNLGDDVRLGQGKRQSLSQGGRVRGAQTSAIARGRDEELRRLVQRWRGSEMLQEQYPTEAEYVRITAKLSRAAAYRRLKALKLSQ